MKLNSGMLYGVLVGVTAGAIASRLISSEDRSKAIKGIKEKGEGLLNNLKSGFSDISQNISERISGNSGLNEDKLREAHLDRTRSTASQFNSH